MFEWILELKNGEKIWNIVNKYIKLNIYFWIIN